MLTMPSWRRRPLHLAASEGHVACPRSGSDVDVDHCLTCGYLESAGEEHQPRTIRCSWRPQADAVVDDASATPWWVRP